MLDSAGKMNVVADGNAALLKASLVTVRDLTLDFVKGVLVVVMVVYHAMNMFTTAGPAEYAYVRFVSGSFILISGYVVVRFQEAKFAVEWHSVSRRLIVRGLKLLILFTLLNLLINLTGIGNPGKVQPGIQRYMNTLFEVYVSGEPGYASFQILLPIAYLLIAAPVFLALRELRLWLFVASVAMAVTCSLSSIESVNLEFMTLGALGISGGMLTNTLNHSFATTGKWTIIGGLLVSIALMKFLSANLVTYALGTMIILKLLYDLGKAVRMDGGLARILVLLGQYSLLCYIAQIIFMQVLYRGLLRPRWGLGYEVAIVEFVTVIFLVLLSAGVAKLRDRYSFAAKAYNLIFL